MIKNISLFSRVTIFELTLLLSPYLIFYFPKELSELIHILKIFFWCLVTILAINFLLPKIYQGFSKNENNKVKKIIYYFSIFSTFIITIISFQLVKLSLPPLAFYLFVFCLLLKVFIFRLQIKSEPLYVSGIFYLIYYSGLCFFSFFVISEPEIFTVLTYSLSIGAALASYQIANQTKLGEELSPLEMRMPAILFLISICFIGLLVIRNMLPVYYLTVFILIPWTYKLSPKRDKEKEVDLMKNFKLLEKLFLVFIAIQVGIRVYLGLLF